MPTKIVPKKLTPRAPDPIGPSEIFQAAIGEADVSLSHARNLLNMTRAAGPGVPRPTPPNNRLDAILGLVGVGGAIAGAAFDSEALGAAGGGLAAGAAQEIGLDRAQFEEDQRTYNEAAQKLSGMLFETEMNINLAEWEAAQNKIAQEKDQQFQRQLEKESDERRAKREKEIVQMEADIDAAENAKERAHDKERAQMDIDAQRAEASRKGVSTSLLKLDREIRGVNGQIEDHLAKLAVQNGGYVIGPDGNPTDEPIGLANDPTYASMMSKLKRLERSRETQFLKDHIDYELEQADLHLPTNEARFGDLIDALHQGIIDAHVFRDAVDYAFNIGVINEEQRDKAYLHASYKRFGPAPVVSHRGYTNTGSSIPEDVLRAVQAQGQ